MGEMWRRPEVCRKQHKSNEKKWIKRKITVKHKTNDYVSKNRYKFNREEDRGDTHGGFTQQSCRYILKAVLSNRHHSSPCCHGDEQRMQRWKHLAALWIKSQHLPRETHYQVLKNANPLHYAVGQPNYWAIPHTYPVAFFYLWQRLDLFR